MVNSIVKIITGKSLIIYEKHRQTLPLVKDLENRKKYWFLKVSDIWRLIPFKSSDKRKHKVMYVILSILNPIYILTTNWISPRESLYKVWTKCHPNSKFIVVQHGSYVGGAVTDIAHRYTKCDVFLTWGDYFTNMFRDYNKGKCVDIITFGNPVYNAFNRESIKQKINQRNKVLLIPSPVTKEVLPQYDIIIKKLKDLGYSIYFKPHSFQKRSKYARLTNVIETKEVLQSLLNENDFDFIISDTSSALLDAIFFKNKVIYFDPSNRQSNAQNNIYATYLKNIYPDCFQIKNKKEIESFIDLRSQEYIISLMYKVNNNYLGSIG